MKKSEALNEEKPKQVRATTTKKRMVAKPLKAILYH